MVILNKIVTIHPLYFARFIPLLILLCLTACGGKDDFANKPVTVTPNEQVVPSSNPNEPPIIIRSPNTNDLNNTYTSPTKSSQRVRKTASSVNYTAPNQTVGKGNYAVQIGAFSSDAIASKAAKQARQQVPALLNSARTNIDIIQKNGKSLYRVKLTGLSVNTASQACSELKQKQLSCIVTQ